MSKPTGKAHRKRKFRANPAFQDRKRLDSPLGQVEVQLPASLAAKEEILAQEVADAAGWLLV